MLAQAPLDQSSGPPLRTGMEDGKALEPAEMAAKPLQSHLLDAHNAQCGEGNTAPLSMAEASPDVSKQLDRIICDRLAQAVHVLESRTASQCDCLIEKIASEQRLRHELELRLDKLATAVECMAAELERARGELTLRCGDDAVSAPYSSPAAFPTLQEPPDAANSLAAAQTSGQEEAGSEADEPRRNIHVHSSAPVARSLPSAGTRVKDPNSESIECTELGDVPVIRLPTVVGELHHSEGEGLAFDQDMTPADMTPPPPHMECDRELKAEATFSSPQGKKPEVFEDDDVEVPFEEHLSPSKSPLLKMEHLLSKPGVASC
eukprot:gnl/TRDRNA2_/TRDRNA2_136524_c0_seq1.p1 gnl/TRDRNA2_/TRDRNA2_136524_c0~~gnl/TRDRNA2_/TRDRNA2_136524_c0_seq1.p1  ORF type:complete len:319 (+),score=62.67 gnl/TRDRNA2_/TRDRNA2_136524_c0_seq1:3-959(+)